MFPFPNNLWGSYVGPTVALPPLKTFYPNGTPWLTFGQSSPLVWQDRAFPSTNRRRLLAGTSTPWIPPSNYKRFVGYLHVEGRGDYRMNGSTIAKDSPIMVNSAVTTWANRGLARPGAPFTSFTARQPVYTGDLNNAVNEASVKALLDLAQGKANMGETLATSKQTLNLFLDTAASLARVALDVKRGHIFKHVRRLNVKQLRKEVPKEMADQWLKFWFGWKPLVGDAYGLYEAFVESMTQPALLVHGRASSRVLEDHYMPDIADLTSSPRTVYDFHEQFNVGVRCNLTARVNSADYLRTINSVGLLNPAQTAWELIPFSFVVDWFLPIGKVLEAMSAPAGLTFVGGHRTVRWVRRTTCSIARSHKMLGNPRIVHDAFGFERTILGGFPRPTPYARSFHKSASRFATMAALLVQLAK